MSTSTTNYGFTKPAVNDPVDANIWGNETNTNWDTLDTDLKAVSDVADAAAAGSPEPGDICYSWRTSKADWVIAQGTIGNAVSGGTNRANEDTADLFAVLWTNLTDTNAPVSGGRGVSAPADFAAGKTITVPDGRGRVLAGRDDMGGTLASRITNAIAGFIGTVLGAFGGNQAQQAHVHGITDSGHTHVVPDIAVQAYRDSPGGNSFPVGASAGASSIVASNSVTGISVNSTGAGASQNVQPTLIANMFYKL